MSYMYWSISMYVYTSILPLIQKAECSRYTDIWKYRHTFSIKETHWFYSKRKTNKILFERTSETIRWRSDEVMSFFLRPFLTVSESFHRRYIHKHTHASLGLRKQRRVLNSLACVSARAPTPRPHRSEATTWLSLMSKLIYYSCYQLRTWVWITRN